MSVKTLVYGTQTNATAVAFQDGVGGAWVALSGENGVYSGPVTDEGGRFGVAVVCARRSSVSVRIYLATLEETTAIVSACLPALVRADTVELSGTVTASTDGCTNGPTLPP